MYFGLMVAQSVKKSLLCLGPVSVPEFSAEAATYAGKQSWLLPPQRKENSSESDTFLFIRRL